MGVNGRESGGSRSGPPKRGLVWFIIFFTVFFLASYLLRKGDDDSIVANSDSTAATQDDGAGGESTEFDSTDEETDSTPLIDFSSDEQPSSETQQEETTPSRTPTNSQSPRGPPAEEDSQYAPLQERGRDVWESPAGLLYKPGSAEGHRIKHLERHFEDDPNRPVHGVFAGNFAEVIGQIDQAYRWSESGDRRAIVRQDRGRTIVIARFDEAVGFVGGERGAEDGNPEVFRVQLVLEDRDVITAYPVE